MIYEAKDQISEAYFITKGEIEIGLNIGVDKGE